MVAPVVRASQDDEEDQDEDQAASCHGLSGS